jgi:tetratricopeptide (TPR) repeat protein
VSGRVLAWPVLAVLILGLGLQTVRGYHRLTASFMLHVVEMRTLSAVAVGQAPPQLMAANLTMLRRAAPFDPVEVGIPTARGTQYLFLLSLDAALGSYQEAQALEPRPEGYFNLGRVQLLAGRREEALRNFAVAVRLDPRLANEIPLAAR